MNQPSIRAALLWSSIWVRPTSGQPITLARYVLPAWQILVTKPARVL
jgi:hypothetical protein